MKPLLVFVIFGLLPSYTFATELDVFVHQFDCEDEEPALRAGPGSLGLITKIKLATLATERVPSDPPKQLYSLSIYAKKKLVIYFTAPNEEAAEVWLKRLEQATRLIYDGPCRPSLRFDDEDFPPANDPDIHKPDHWAGPV